MFYFFYVEMRVQVRERARRLGLVAKVLPLRTLGYRMGTAPILAAPLSIQPRACGLGKYSCAAQGLGTLYSRGRPKRAPGS